MVEDRYLCQSQINIEHKQITDVPSNKTRLQGGNEMPEKLMNFIQILNKNQFLILS